MWLAFDIEKVTAKYKNNFPKNDWKFNLQCKNAQFSKNVTKYQIEHVLTLFVVKQKQAIDIKL